jgi:hypothetical protein
MGTEGEVEGMNTLADEKVGAVLYLEWLDVRRTLRTPPPLVTADAVANATVNGLLLGFVKPAFPFLPSAHLVWIPL